MTTREELEAELEMVKEQLQAMTELVEEAWEAAWCREETSDFEDSESRIRRDMILAKDSYLTGFDMDLY